MDNYTMIEVQALTYNIIIHYQDIINYYYAIYNCYQ